MCNICKFKFCFRMAFSQETETIETILQSLGLEHLISSFQEADINIQLLMESTDKEVKEVLTDIHITPGNRLRIMKQINRSKAGGMVMYIYLYGDLNIFRKFWMNTQQYYVVANH